MTIKQVSVFLENVAGRLAEITKVLSEGGINLRAMTIADTADFGILRIVADDPEKTVELCEKNGFTARITEVLAVEIEDRPGALLSVMQLFHKSEINIEYLYASLEQNRDNAVIIFKIEDVERGSQILEENGLKTIASF